MAEWERIQAGRTLLVKAIAGGLSKRFIANNLPDVGDDRVAPFIDRHGRLQQGSAKSAYADKVGAAA